jgi:glycosidase
MARTATSDVWWRNAVLYCLQVRNFGGDLDGVTARLDHIAELGATCVWLMPFYPSPGRDDGYDITDYFAVDHRFGDLGDLAVLLRHAHDRGLRVIVDLVPNHTSIEHPWFRAHPEWYVWEDEPDERGPDHWTFDDERGQYYLHSFQPFQPDLDIRLADVRERIARIMDFWLDVGVDGFRIDAVPFLVEEEGPRGIDTEKGKRWLRELRNRAGRRRGDAVLVGEVNVPQAEVGSYFDELHMQLGFLINQRTWLSLAREQAAPLEDLIRGLAVPPLDGGWATFLRNHDELSLDKLSEDEQAEVQRVFAPDERMRIYGHGIRRRVASMLDGPKLRAAWSLLFSLPGSPVVLYGDEIGLHEDLALEGRTAVRVPMDWDEVARQREDPDSLLQFFRDLIARRRSLPELGFGTSTLIENEPPALFAHRCEWMGSTVIAAHNLSGEPVEAVLDGVGVRLEPYGSRWIRR